MLGHIPLALPPKSILFSSCAIFSHLVYLELENIVMLRYCERNHGTCVGEWFERVIMVNFNLTEISRCFTSWKYGIKFIKPDWRWPDWPKFAVSPTNDHSSVNRRFDQPPTFTPAVESSKRLPMDPIDPQTLLQKKIEGRELFLKMIAPKGSPKTSPGYPGYYQAAPDEIYL